MVVEEEQILLSADGAMVAVFCLGIVGAPGFQVVFVQERDAGYSLDALVQSFVSYSFALGGGGRKGNFAVIKWEREMMR